MRDLVFKNLTSYDKKRRIITSSEIMDNQGMRSIIRRHFVYIIKEVKPAQTARPMPYLYLLKERNTKEQIEKFFCRIKGSVYTVSNEKMFLILFMHSLKITMMATSHSIMGCNEGG